MTDRRHLQLVSSPTTTGDAPSFPGCVAGPIAPAQHADHIDPPAAPARSFSAPAGPSRVGVRRQLIGHRLLHVVAEAGEATPALERAVSALAEARALATWCGEDGEPALELALHRTLHAFNDLGLAAAAASAEVAALIETQSTETRT